MNQSRSKHLEIRRYLYCLIFHFRPPLEGALLFAIIASAAVRVRAFHIPQSRPIHKVSLHASTTDSNNDDDDLWNADISPLQQQRHNSEEQYDWTWSILPLPEHADNQSIAERARCAMMSSSSTNNHHHSNNKQPAALQDRCSVNLDAFHNGRCKAQWLHVDPPVLTVDNFFTEQECDDIRRITISPPPAGVVRVIKLKSRLSESKSNNQGTAVRLSTTLHVRYGAHFRLRCMSDMELHKWHLCYVVGCSYCQIFNWNRRKKCSLYGTWEMGRDLDGMRMH